MDRDLYDDLSGEYQAPSQDFESEKAILALCMRRKETMNEIVGNVLTADDFADKRNGIIYSVINDLYMQSENVDKFIIIDALSSMGQLAAAGGQEYILSVADTPAVATNISSYVKSVHDKSLLRQIYSLFDTLKKDSQKGKYSVNSLVDHGIGKLNELRENTDGTGFEALLDILKRNLNEIHEVSAGKKNQKMITTGFRALNRVIGGFRPGTLNIIAARPAMGKTALVINMAVNAASMQGANVNIFSLEMSKQEIGNRILATRSNTSAKKLQKAKLTFDEEKELTDVFSSMAQLPIYIDDKSSVTPMSMMSKCKELKSQGKLGLVIVDYLQLMSMPGRGNSGSRQQEISDISRSLKILAKDLEVPVIALSQLSRGTEKRENHTPMLSDLRDSGAIEQDADCVMFIDRDDYYSKDETPPPIQDAKIIVAKNRHGETATVFLKWMGSRTLFFEDDKPYDPQDPTKTGGQSSFTRTVSAGAAKSDYNFEEPPISSSNSDGEGEGNGGGFDVPFDTGDNFDGNPSNDDMFGDANSDFPEGF